MLEEETKLAIGPTVVSSGDQNMVGKVLVEGMSRDSRPLCLRQERGGARLSNTRKWSVWDSIAPEIGPPPATWTAFGEPLGY